MSTQSHLATQTWRVLISNGSNLKFNPPIEYIHILNGTACIHFVHTGKCAGESIISSLSRDTKNITLLVYHAYDAGQCISKAINYLQNNNKAAHFFIVATRDPLKRWESSFNWDLHNQILKKNISIKNTLLANYENINLLAQGIANGEQKALQLGEWGHMGLGLHAYVPINELNNIPKSRLFAIRTEKINQDYSSILRLLPNEYLDQRIIDLKSNKRVRSGAKVPRSKDKYKNDYPSGTFSELKEIYFENIKEFLADDYAAHDLLACRARNIKRRQ